MKTLSSGVEPVNPMRAYEQQLTLKALPGNEGLLDYFSEQIGSISKAGSTPIRFVVTESGDQGYKVEIGQLDSPLESASIFDFKKRSFENTSIFNAVMLVPTGIGSVQGGHAGDAAPASRLLASVCDNLITHPNVVNASDINEMSDNTLYVEGSVICRLLMGSIGLQKVRSNRVLTVIEKHPNDELFVNGAINSVNAARAAAGLECSDILVLDPAMKLIAESSASGRAIGRVENLDHLFSELKARSGDYDNVAITSIIKIPTRQLHYDYFHCGDEMVNPWGGVEAIFTHALSSVFNVQSAHSPMIEDQLISNMDVGIVDPRKAAEAVSFTYMQCILKGLQRAPRIVSDSSAFTHDSVLSAADISCLVIPDGCIGLPTLAALEQGIPVIAVRSNSNIMKNDLTQLPWQKGQFHQVENYLEAAGVMSAIKSGIALDSIRRPIFAVSHTSNSENSYQHSRTEPKVKFS
ncbi:MAG: DUF3326 domain-containing protein [Pseudohongiellaceae bacterium]